MQPDIVNKIHPYHTRTAGLSSRAPRMRARRAAPVTTHIWRYVPLMIGRAIGAYKVVARLGAGGMGEVWLAEDTRLGRKVAIRLLPAGATHDADGVRRFVQEARAASALNHPHNAPDDPRR